KVRTTHGVNCTGSCSWDVYVKNGLIMWEVQATDYPDCGPGLPDHEPRGCPRGCTFSWYTYSPVRIKYPYVRSELLDMWRRALKECTDPVTAWQRLSNDPKQARAYQRVRGKGGLVRVSWEEAATLVAASLVQTIKQYGPDRIFGFTPIPAMSMVCYASGARFLSLIGASMISFYDWYADLPPASPQIWGEQTDVPESADWFEAAYMIVWGTNLPMTRTPDAHFYTEARYRGAKVTAVAPDYAEYCKFADTWLPARAGTDGALAMAMTQVIFKEYYLDRQSAYFTEYAKTYTDLPFLVRLDPGESGWLPGRFLRASDIGSWQPNAEWKPLLWDAGSDKAVVPNGGIGFRWGEEGRWNLHLKNAQTEAPLDPVLSFSRSNQGWCKTRFPVFAVSGSGAKTGYVPVRKIEKEEKEIFVATVFDLMAANLGLMAADAANLPADADLSEYPADFQDPKPYTPAWQERITGVAAAEAVRVAREFAETAEKTRGRAMIFLGAGTNHWFHSDMTYRAIINLTTLCGCQGVNGGGWAHYVGQEKIRPISAWAQIAFALDWKRPPRQVNGTSFFYFASGQWRYESMDAGTLASPLHRNSLPFRHPADYNALAARLGWLPSYPQFDENPLETCRQAEADGAESDEAIIASVEDRIKNGDLRFAIEDPDHPNNFPRVLFLWRANLLGASGKGHEYFLKHLLGVESAVSAPESSSRPEQIRWREPAPEGKLDLLVTMEMRMSTSALYSDVVLPAASWYEMHDLSTTDMHPFIHPFNPAIDPPWDTRSNWDQFKAIAEKFSSLAEEHLGRQKDLVATPLAHDTPGEIAQPRVRDWKSEDSEPAAGRNLPHLAVVERDYPNVCAMMTALGPLAARDGMGAKGVAWKADQEYERLKQELGTVAVPGVSQGLPRLHDGRDVASAILGLAPETNGATAVKSWRSLEKVSGLKLSHLSRDREGERMTFADLTAQPREIMTSPTWSGMESKERRYSPFVINIEQKLPFRTLTGRAQFYMDHEWMLAFGENLPLYRPPLDMQALGSTGISREPGQEIILNYLTPHSKWSIHSTYSDTLVMLTLFRGGEAIWINNEDARSIEVRDNDWLECFNVNGVVMARAVVSHRIPRGKAFMYHAQERLITTPGSKRSGQRGGTHNSVTRIVVKPTHMIGGYAQFSYFFNYYGPTGTQRDEVIVVRKAGEIDWYED
ncbi:MAG: nitrate reductase subunit alpha, partial [Desulfohalobiaceae bacterium]|nr:nitrate reductase subunit alpha [Desulfohalobiaceae bacterium]